MINSTFGGFMTARLGMSAAQHGLHLTGQNLTNSATEGYTRQRIDQVSINYSGTFRYASKWNVNIGNGVLVTGTSQLRDPFLDLRYRNEMAHVGYENIKTSVMGDLADILDEIKNSSEDAISGGGIFNQLGDILEKLHQLSNEVGNKEFDNMVKTSCQQLTTLLNSYSDRIDEVENNLTYDLYEVDVPRVNEILQSISELNKTIKSSEIHGESALELKDQRNLLIDELSEYMKINVTYKPVQVSDSTVVDELYISMENSDPDGTDYMLVADEQYRELLLTPDLMQNVGTDAVNITLSEMKVDIQPPQTTPVDPDAEATLDTAKRVMEKAEAANDPIALAKAFIAAHESFAKAIADNNTSANDVTNKTTAYETAKQDYLDAKDALDAAEEALALKKADPNATEQDIEDAEKAVTDAIGAVSDAYTARSEARTALREAESAARTTEKAYAEAEKAYADALEDLPKNPSAAFNPDTGNMDLNLYNAVPASNFGGLKDANGNIIYKLPYKDPLNTSDPLVGGNAVQDYYDNAADKLAAAQAAYDQSVIDSAQPTETDANGNVVPIVINEAFTDGKLRGTLEMLNEEGDYTNDDIRGIGYYRNMLDTFANTFADAMNAVNCSNRKDVPLFTTEGGDTDGITAGNIRIAQDWMDNKYGVTATTRDDALEGANDNILRFISLFDRDCTYTTKLEDDPFNTNGTNTGKEVFNGTFEEAFTNISVVLGLDIKASTENLHNYEQLSSSISETRDGVTGVSLDEEAMHIMQYQQSYNASARLMTALDEMLNTLITGTGVVGR